MSERKTVSGPAIRVRELRRTYRRRGSWFRSAGPEIVALHGIDLEIPAGEVHGLLGPNGAGKSTLCKILSTVLLPTSGSVEILGHDVVPGRQFVRQRLSLVLGGERGLYGRLTARQNLRFWAALHNIGEAEANRRSDRLLERVGLDGRGDDQVETFSRGMKQRLHLARGLLSEPTVILLDEPTVGMDPLATRDFHGLLREIRDDRTILLATHDMTEAEALCDRVSVIDKGRVVATETPATLASWITRFERIDVGPLPEELAARLGRLPGVGRVAPSSDGGTRIETVAEGATAEVLRLLLDNGQVNVRTSLPTLEEVYLHLLGGEPQEVG